jgi:hypothetical protein
MTLSLIGGAVMAAIAFYVARCMADASSVPPWKVYAGAFIAAVVLSVMASAILGTHDEDGDPIYGAGTRVIDRNTTSREREAHGWKVFTLIVIPSLVGVRLGLARRKD